MARKDKTKRPRVLDVVAEGELREEPDWDKAAWALLQYVKLQREKAERKAQQPKSEAAE
jgi:hypothetical protein